MKQSLHLGLIGLGGRGSFLLENLLLSMDDVEIAAVCDLYEDRREHAAEVVREGAGAALQGLCGLPSPPGKSRLGRRPHRLFLAGSCRHGPPPRCAKAFTPVSRWGAPIRWNSAGSSSVPGRRPARPV